MNSVGFFYLKKYENHRSNPLFFQIHISTNLLRTEVVFHSKSREDTAVSSVIVDGEWIITSYTYTFLTARCQTTVIYPKSVLTRHNGLYRLRCSTSCWFLGRVDTFQSIYKLGSNYDTRNLMCLYRENKAPPTLFDFAIVIREYDVKKIQSLNLVDNYYEGKRAYSYFSIFINLHGYNLFTADLPARSSTTSLVICFYSYMLYTNYLNWLCHDKIPKTT